MKSSRSYSELIQIPTYEERYNYLRCNEKIGDDTFGGSRYLNQVLYSSNAWKSFRRKIILRDKGCDLGMSGYEIDDHIVIHHLNPLTIEQVKNMDPCIFDPENVISCSETTHKAIHYGDVSLLMTKPIERKPNDMIPWR